ncbi:MAG: hypothetical protein LBO76_07195 [Treponema sp.]|nr:hypothetical protein [Treponema sp.]
MTKRNTPAAPAGYFFCFAAVLCSISIFTPACTRYKKSAGIETSEISPYLKDGDIICRLGDRLWSLYFRDISPTDKRFSHLGIVRIHDGTVSVINAEGHTIGGQDSVNEVPLQEFIKIAKTLAVYRVKSVNGSTISTAAMEYKGYPFDWKFDMNDEKSLYCTELLYAVLRRTAPEITLKTTFISEIGRSIIPLEACSNSGDFDEILYIAR